MESIGSVLRSERLRRGLKLEQVSEWTKIGQIHLEAMEQDCFDRLPGGLFTRSFLRQYARTLDLDEEQLMAAFRERYEAPAVPLPSPPPKIRSIDLPLMHPLGWLVIALLFGGGVYTLWENLRRSLPHAEVAAAVPAVPARPQPGALGSVAPAPQRAPVPPQSVRNFPSTAGEVLRVVFSATEPVWLSIQSDGNHFYSGTLEGQQKKELAASSKIIALIGNAGGIDVALNGTSIGSLGEHGQVRLLELTPRGARVIERTPLTGADLRDQKQLSAERQF